MEQYNYLSIDFGTSFCRAAILSQDGPILVPSSSSNRSNDYLFPTVAYVTDNGEIHTCHIAERKRMENPSRFLFEFKLNIGTKKSLFPDCDVTYTNVVTAILKEIKKDAIRISNGRIIENLLLTIPAIYSGNDERLLVMKEAAKLAGFKKTELLSEPEAAAIYYSYVVKNENKETTALIYDLGGGTFDPALIRIKNNGYMLLGSNTTGGSFGAQCGGKFIDAKIFADFKQKTSFTLDPEEKDSIIEIQKFCREDIKHSLSIETSISLPAPPFRKSKYSLARKDLEKMISPLVNRTLNECDELLNKSEVAWSDLDVILLVGGSCSVPYVREKIKRHKELMRANKAKIIYNLTESNKCIDPEFAVCLGGIIHVKDKDKVTYPKYIKNDMKDRYRRNLTAFIRDLNVNDADNADMVIDGTVARYVQTCTQVKKVIQREDLKGYFTEEYITDLNAFVDRCVSNEFHIAIIGTINAGKSTLINALLERDLASTNINPETAALTKFKSAENDYIKVSFYNRTDWQELWDSVERSNAKVFKDEYAELSAKELEHIWIGHDDYLKTFENEKELSVEIKSWTSVSSAKHYFVKEVEIGLKNLDIPKEVVFVDTPGLDDPVQYRSDITRKYIDRGNLVLVCVNAQTLTGIELETIYRVFANTRYNPGKVFVLGTQIDRLSNPLIDSESLKGHWLKFLKDINCYNDKDLANKNVLYVSAFLYSIICKYQVTPDLLTSEEKKVLYTGLIKFDYDIEQLNNSTVLEELKMKTNLLQVKELLLGDPVKKAKTIIVQDITDKYKHLKFKINDSFGEVKLAQEEMITGLNNGIEDIRKKLTEKKKEVELVDEEIKELNDYLQDIKANSVLQVKELVAQLKEV
jgi:actin-like ATPase involved in cell morphogenesis/GTPase SAR1 family protein